MTINEPSTAVMDSLHRVARCGQVFGPEPAKNYDVIVEGHLGLVLHAKSFRRGSYLLYDGRVYSIESSKVIEGTLTQVQLIEEKPL